MDDETVLNQCDEFYVWREPKPGATLIGTYIGRIAVTDRRLLFLSAGTSGLGRAAIAAALGGPLAMATVGRTKTGELDVGALRNEGSLSVALSRVRSCKVTRRWDFSSYLTIETSGEDGAPPVCAFMTKLGWNKPFLEAFKADLDRARDRVLAASRL